LFGPLASLAKGKSPALTVAWRDGFPDELFLAETSTAELHETYRLARALPLARYIRKIVVGPTTNYTQLVNAMVSLGVPPQLRSLHLGANATRPIHGGDVRALIGSIPQLEDLDLDIATGVFAPFESRTLKRLVLHALEPTLLLESTAPALIDLELRACAGAAGFLDKLARSWLLPQLKRLTIWRCGFEDPELLTICMHARRFAHLDVLDLRHNRFTARGITEAKLDLPNLIAGVRDA
jgi:hypothetical protein